MSGKLPLKLIGWHMGIEGKNCPQTMPFTLGLGPPTSDCMNDNTINPSGSNTSLETGQ